MLRPARCMAKITPANVTVKRFANVTATTTPSARVRRVQISRVLKDLFCFSWLLDAASVTLRDVKGFDEFFHFHVVVGGFSRKLTFDAAKNFDARELIDVPKEDDNSTSSAAHYARPVVGHGYAGSWHESHLHGSWAPTTAI